MTFLQLIAEACGDKMPNRNFINLPFSSRDQLYDKYLEYFDLYDPLRSARCAASRSYFYTTWSTLVPDVRNLKNTGFQKCSECVFYNEERARNILNRPVLRQLKAAAKDHYNEMTGERRGYELRKQLASIDPLHYLSLVVDGADQPNYGLPHHVQASKDDRGHKIAVKIIGILIHGVEKDLSLFSMVEAFETGANHIIESIHRTLELRKEKLTKLPPKLFVQVDNCTRENKNRFFLAYLEMLVQLGVFVEVQMSSLPVGHTHTDIDQSFSCVHKRLDNHEALSLQQLHDQLKKSYAPPPYVDELSRVANFSGLCKSTNSVRNVSQFTQYRYFRLLRSSDSPTVDGFYKTKCLVKRRLPEEWVPLPGSRHVGFLAKAPNLKAFPTTQTRVSPNVREVNLCPTAAETRIYDRKIFGELYALRNRVYTAREYEGHWREDSFELNGDYRPESAIIEEDMSLENVLITAPQHARHTRRLNYDVGDFIAVNPSSTSSTPFWIAQITGFGDLDNEGYPDTLQVRWYSAGVGEDPFLVTYKPGFFESRPWFSAVHVDTLMLRFDGLTTRKRLKRATVTKLQSALSST